MASLMLALFRSRQSAFSSPAVRIESLRDYSSRQSESSSPFAQCFRNPIQCQMPRSSAVANLLTRCAPANITWFVVAVVVNTVKRVFRGRRAAYVSQESFIRVPPAITHMDSPSPVSRVTLERRIRTSRNHCPPRAPFFSAATIRGVAVASVNRAYKYRGALAVKASATLALSAFYTLRPHRFHGATITAAHPKRTMASVCAWFYADTEHSQAIETCFYHTNTLVSLPQQEVCFGLR